MAVPTLVLIGCSSRKAKEACAVRDFYLGTLFKASVEWTESCKLKWGVISTKYGFVLPDQIIAPYNETFASFAKGSVGYRKITDGWRLLVRRQLLPYKGRRMLSILGKEYENIGLPLFNPFKYLWLGARVKWLWGHLGMLPSTIIKP